MMTRNSLSLLTLYISVFISVNCSFPGENCTAEGRSGSCSLLSECLPLMEEIGIKPLSLSLRMTLQRLSCGFQNDEQLVCCVMASVSDSENRSPWQSQNHGMESGGNWNREQIPQQSTSNSGIDRDTNKQEIERETPLYVSRHRNLRLLPRECGVIDSDRIVGGSRTRMFQMPWMVLLEHDSGRDKTLSCGGTLITEWYVLTAAHCVSFLGGRKRLSAVILGEYDVGHDPDCETVEGETSCAPKIKNVSIESVIPHPGFSLQNMYDDIALVRLSEPADFMLDNMKPICLPITPALQRETLVGVNGTVAGWGVTENNRLQSPVLLSVELSIIANDVCQATYNGDPRIYNRQLCAGGVQGQDSCGADSGGPLIYPGKVGSSGARYIQRGIVSYGPKQCGVRNRPGVYTRVAFYMDWILDNMRS